ncbi:MAG TPA: MiaB/RimO family radical SAM methylthiotransferase [Candidatus Omnitrophica bacterium]|nr:MiaB/RimO family radical SAM methylthiotransferase [Candidatus Omnitrophota bacterium]
MLKKTFSIISLGCFRNTYDSEVVAKRFLDKGFNFKKDFKNCHTLIINTCGFIDKAKEESLEAIKEAIDLKKKGKIKELFVFGCLVERYYEKLKKFFPEVDRWQGIEKFDSCYTPRKKILPPYIDFLKICEGCLNRCSFCAIPLIKGELKSKSRKELLKEVKELDREGIKELNIIGQDITSWGEDLGKNFTFTRLLKDILKEIKNIKWVRLIYTHPRHFNEDLIDLIAWEEKICKYIDLPIQHINDRILKLMNRKITKREIIFLIDKIRKKIPQVVLRTSIIVGFPTETEKEFKELLKFLEEVKFERLGCFIYSREEETPAYKLPQVHPSTKKRRFNELMSLQKEIASRVNKRFLGKSLKVLVEQRQDDLFIGRSQFDAYEVDGVVFLKKERLSLGEFYQAKIVDVYDYDLLGI